MGQEKVSLCFIMRGKSVHTLPSGPIQIWANTFAMSAASQRWSLPCTARAVLNNLRRW
jgi:hypothetical protein